jgi:hypothetical protein
MVQNTSSKESNFSQSTSTSESESDFDIENEFKVIILKYQRCHFYVFM